MGRYKSKPGFLGDPPATVVGPLYGTNPIGLPSNLGCSPLQIWSGREYIEYRGSGYFRSPALSLSPSSEGPSTN